MQTREVPSSSGEVTLATVFLEKSKAEPADLVSAQPLLAVLGPDHPLVLPLDQEGVLLHDFSALDLHLASFAQGSAAPELPVEVEPLWRLCRRHRRLIREGEVWRYRFFYLELLAREGKLVPLFWGNFLRLERELGSASRLRYYAELATCQKRKANAGGRCGPSKPKAGSTKEPSCPPTSAPGSPG